MWTICLHQVNTHAFISMPQWEGSHVGGLIWNNTINSLSYENIHVYVFSPEAVIGQRLVVFVI